MFLFRFFLHTASSALQGPLTLVITIHHVRLQVSSNSEENCSLFFLRCDALQNARMATLKGTAKLNYKARVGRKLN